MNCTICGNTAELTVAGLDYCWPCVNFCSACSENKNPCDIEVRGAGEVMCKSCWSHGALMNIPFVYDERIAMAVIYQGELHSNCLALPPLAFIAQLNWLVIVDPEVQETIKVRKKQMKHLVDCANALIGVRHVGRMPLLFAALDKFFAPVIRTSKPEITLTVNDMIQELRKAWANVGVSGVAKRR